MVIKVIAVYFLIALTLVTGMGLLEFNGKLEDGKRGLYTTLIKIAMVIIGLYFFLVLATERWI